MPAPVDTVITNAVRCVPPGNRPTAAEIAACRPFLAARIADLPRLRAALCLGRVAHDAVVRALGGRPGAHRFAHGARHEIGGLAVFSRYNVNTGRVTADMIRTVLFDVKAFLDTGSR